MSCRHFRALLWKNWLLKKRSPWSACCECVLPLGFVALMIAVYYAFSPTYYTTQAFTEPWGIQMVPPYNATQDVDRAVPFSITPYRLQLANQLIAVLPADPFLQSYVDQFVSDMSSLYLPFNGSAVVGGVFSAESPINTLYIPGFADVVATFASESDLEANITSTGYGSGGSPRIFVAIVFNSGPPNWDYTIRMNSSEIPSTQQSPTNNVQRGSVTTYTQEYSMSTPSYGGAVGQKPANLNPVLTQSMPGFLTFQLMVDRWIINQRADPSTMDLDQVTYDFAFMTTFIYSSATSQLSFGTEMAKLKAANLSGYAAVAERVAQFMQSESYLPQQVEFVPFPIFGYQSNTFYTVASDVFAFFFVMVFLYPVSRLIRGLVMEKETKIREGMRMMGLSDSALLFSWMVTYIIIYFGLSVLIALITSRNIFSNSSGAMIFITFFLFGLSTISYSYLISVFFSRAKTAATIGVVLFFAGFFPYYAVYDPTTSTTSKNGGSILSPTAFGLVIDIISAYENEGLGVTAANSSSFINNYAVATGLAYMFFDFLLYGLLGWYIDNVMPASLREFGVPRPWYFPLTLSYWREAFNCRRRTAAGRKDAPASSSSSSASAANGTATNAQTGRGFRLPGFHTGPRAHNGQQSDPSFIEQPDPTLKAKEREGRAVVISKLRKEFGTPDGVKVAVDDVDMTMYEGQIFVLLGHNGAGKTTTISMLTGLLEPTDGRMSIYGLDVGSDLSSIRKDLGVCPQHDVLWPDLTVKEHLQIYAAIKEVPRKDVDKEITKALAQVGLTEKVNVRSSSLSGGMKRKLSVCIALVGGSRVIFLDEPTSGMDPYSRRSTWQILQNAREGRVIILTTHFMDEADLLGDRIAIMANGIVKCCGSPMFLKRRYGVGYMLTFVKSGQCNVRQIQEMVRRHVPDMTVATNVGAELSLRLPLTASAIFSSLFAEVDGRSNELGILSYGIGITTMEEVFLKVAHGVQLDAPTSDAEPEAASNGLKPTASHNPLPIAVSMADKATSSPSARVSQVVPLVRDGPLDSAPSHIRIPNKMNRDRCGSDGQGDISPGVVSEAKGLAAVRAAARAQQHGLSMHIRHFRAMFLKRWHISRRDYKAICFQLFIPILMVAGGLALLQLGIDNSFPSYQFSTAQFNANTRTNPNEPLYPDFVPWFDFKSTANPIDSSGLQSLLQSFPQANASTTSAGMEFNATQAAAIVDTYGLVDTTECPQRDWQRMSAYLLESKASSPASKYGAYVVEMDNTPFPSQDPVSLQPVITYSVLYNTTGIHTAPIFMNLMDSAIYAYLTGDSSNAIITRTQPLPLTSRQATLRSSFYTFGAATIIVMAFAFIPASYAIFVVKEREVSAKHQQLISGVSILAYWGSTFLWDSISYLIPAAGAVILCVIFNVQDFVSTDSNRVAALILLFWLYGTSVAPFTYCLSYLFRSHSTAQNTVLFVNIFCLILMIASLIMSQVSSTCYADAGLRYVYRLLPGFDLGNGLMQLSFLSQLPLMNAACEQEHGVAVTIVASYDALDPQATGLNIIYMAVLTIGYFVLAVAIDIALSHPRIRLWLQRDPTVTDAPYNDDIDVIAEQERIQRELQTVARAGGDSSGTFTDVILLNRLRKVYKGMASENDIILRVIPVNSSADGKVAVKGLSYGVPVGEVFGFLGINGAGKTTTLQMLSGDVLPSAGTAKLAGYDIINQQPSVRRLLGYCPQWDALLELLTTREHLEMYARIKGVPEDALNQVVGDKLKELDLVQFANKKAGTLSGGNKRKLSVAIAMIGNPPIIFLDEPSTGMDPVARRFMWDVISRVATKQKICSIILTTHSMEECEALCQRVGIMVGGRLRCLGSIQHLKSRFGQGFLAEIKLDDSPVELINDIIFRIQEATGDASGYIARRSIPPVAQYLGNAGRGTQVTGTGTGWALAAAFERSLTPFPNSPPAERTIPVHDFAEWWANEDMARNMTAYITTEAFPGATVIERHGQQLRYKLPPQQTPLGVVFSKVESVRERLHIRSYAVGQTSLEQIFNSFASQQEEERNVARGMVVRMGAEPVSRPNVELPLMAV